MRVCGAAIIAGAAACSLLTNLDGLSGGPDGPDGAPDGSLADAGTVHDDAVAPQADGGRDGESDGPFCAALGDSATYCEDFDEVPFGAKYERFVDDGGALALDPASAASPPNALRSSMAAAAAPPKCRYAFYKRALGTTFGASARFEYDVRIGHVLDQGGFPSLLSTNSVDVSAPDGGTSCSYYLTLAPEGAVLVIEPVLDLTPSQQIPVTTTLTVGKWMRVGIEVAGSPGTAGTVSVSLSGVLVIDKEPITANCKLGRVADVELGLFCIGALGSDAELRSDNVALFTK
jgi:hypothetical protein